MRSMAARRSTQPHMLSEQTIVTLDQLLEARPWLTQRKVRQLVAERTIPFYKPGRRLLFNLTDIDNRIQESRVEARR
jgi:excisionase family DNA binding protein